MRVAPILVFTVATTIFAASATAQLRPGMPPVITPEPAPPAAMPPDPADLMQRRYAAAGRPRIALFWNTALGDAFGNRQLTVEATVKSASDSKTSLRQSTSGPAGDATQADDEGSSKSTTTTTRETQSLDDTKRQTGMREAPAAVLENSFTAELDRAGLVLVDRALVMRKTAANRHRGGADAKLVETDAIVGGADLLLEVLMVEDKQVPSGWGFNVRVKNIGQGTLVDAFYTTATPPSRVTPGRWTTTEQGFAYVQGEALPTTLGEVGTTLARKVMERLAVRLPVGGGAR